MLRMTDQILSEVMVQIKDHNEQISEGIRNMLDMMEYDGLYTGKTLMEKLELKSKEGFRRNYLHPAIQMNLIRMTVPDKPNSRNQRYIRT